MNKIKCEICESDSLIKKDGIYVCQNCGTKYSAEEVKKLFKTEPRNIVENTVKIDNSSRVDNLYQVARNSKNNVRRAKECYEQILIEDPNSWEAIFYTAFYGTIDGKRSELLFYAQQMIDCIEIVFKQLKKNLESAEVLVLAEIGNSENVSKARNDFEETFSKCFVFAQHIYDEAWNYHQEQQLEFDEYTPSNISTQCLDEMFCRQRAAAEIMYILGDTIYNLFGVAEKQKAIEAWDRGVKLHNEFVKFMTIREEKEAAKEEILGYVNKIQKIDSSYQTPKVNTRGCYIATAVYGSYDCPQVWTLRRFRDDVLASTWYGNLFVRIYYTISPILIKWFKNKKWFQTIWRFILDRLVYKLKARGFLDSPYEDRI